MELLIKHNWTQEQRQEEIWNFIQLVGIELYNRCNSHNYNKKISLNLCITYIDMLIRKHFKKLDFGYLKIELNESFVANVEKLSEEIEESKNNLITI